ncbi:2'-5' RNA ligase family protein [Streptomyces avidinii]
MSTGTGADSAPGHISTPTTAATADRAVAAPAGKGSMFSSHRADTPLKPYLDALAEFEGTPWQVDTLSLVRSNLPVSGVPGEQPRYETVRAWPLGG